MHLEKSLMILLFEVKNLLFPNDLERTLLSLLMEHIQNYAYQNMTITYSCLF